MYKMNVNMYRSSVLKLLAMYVFELPDVSLFLIYMIFKCFC